MSFFKVTMHRSAIGLPKQTHSIIKSLGLRKRGSVVYHNIVPSVAGMILAVKEIVRVELVDKKLTPAEHRATMKSNSGYVIEKSFSKK
ncbi:50s ribosomal protein [Dipodascopsis uninucleata]